MRLLEALKWIKGMLPSQRMKNSGGRNLQIGAVHGDFHQTTIIHYHVAPSQCQRAGDKCAMTESGYRYD